MPIMLRNVVFDTQRSSFTPSTGVTGLPLNLLTDRTGNMRQVTQMDYAILPEGALKSVFALCVDVAEDIQLMDTVLNIRYNDGVTLWFPLAANEYWRVLFLNHTPPGPLEHKQCYLGRFTGGGRAT